MLVLEKLRKGNVSFLAHLSIEDKQTIIELICNAEDCDYIFKTILSIFKSTDNWYDMEVLLFNKIYLKGDFEEYTRYLLDK